MPATNVYVEKSHVPSARASASSCGEQPPADSRRDILQAEVLETLMRDITATVIDAHQPSLERRPVMNKRRRSVFEILPFQNTLNSLQRAYSQLLHETFDRQWSSEIAASVRNFAESIVRKLTGNCQELPEEGKGLMEDMLAHLQREFKWEKVLSILESAADVARSEEANAYESAMDSRARLQEISDKGDDNQLR